MADVYRATHQGVPVAVKILRPQADPLTDRDVIERFRREARILRQIDHPHVISMIDVLETDGMWALVMPFAEGGDLGALLMQDPPDVVPALGLLAQVAEGLAHLAIAGVVHRDLKPRNVLIVADRGSPHILISDFGIGAVLDETRTKGALTWGSEQFMAPELKLSQSPTPAADVYSLGVMAYLMLTGTLPPIHPECPVDMPDPLWDLLRRMLSRRVSDRPTAQEALVGFRAAIIHPGLKRLHAFPVTDPDSCGADTAARGWWTRARGPGRGPSRMTGGLAVAGLAAIAVLGTTLWPWHMSNGEAGGSGGRGGSAASSSPVVPIPAVSGVPVFTDSFSRVRASTWGPGWGPGIDPRDGDEGAATVEESSGVLSASNLGNFDPRAQISRRVQSVSLSSGEAVFRFKLLSGGGTLWLMAQANPQLDAASDYQLGISTSSGHYWLEAQKGYGTVDLGPAKEASEPITLDPRSWYWARVRLADGRFQARIWDADFGEPASWTIDVPARQTFAGRSWGLSVGPGDAAVASSFALDDITISRVGAKV